MHFLHELVLRENLIEEQSIFPLVTKFILTILSLDDELLLSGENQCWSFIWAFKGQRSQQDLPSPKRLSVPAQVCKKSSSVDVRRSKLHHIPENSPFLKMTVWKQLDIAEDGNTPIMTSSIVPLNIQNDRENLHNLRATWLSMGYGPRQGG